MKKLLQIIIILIGLGIIIFELSRLFGELTEAYSDIAVTEQVVKEARDVVRESDVLNYVKAIELNMLGEIEEIENNTKYYIKDYNIRVSSTNPTSGVFIMNGDSVEEGLFKYEIDVGHYYACYTNGKVKISKTLRQVKSCEDLKEDIKNA